MSTPPHHEDRHHKCGGLWIGGVCARCMERCDCPACAAYHELAGELLTGEPVQMPDGVDENTRIEVPESWQVGAAEARNPEPLADVMARVMADIPGGRWSEHDGE